MEDRSYPRNLLATLREAHTRRRRHRSSRPPFKMRLGLRSVRRLELASWRIVNAVFDASHKIFAAGMALATCAGPRTE